MNIEEGVLYIQDPISDEGVEELIAILSQEEIERIQIDSDTIDPAAMQVLLCSGKSKKIAAKESFFQLLFDNVVDKKE